MKTRFFSALAWLKAFYKKRWEIETYSGQRLKGNKLNPATMRKHKRYRIIFSKRTIKGGVITDGKT